MRMSEPMPRLAVSTRETARCYTTPPPNRPTVAGRSVAGLRSPAADSQVQVACEACHLTCPFLRRATRASFSSTPVASGTRRASAGERGWSPARAAARPQCRSRLTARHALTAFLGPAAVARPGERAFKRVQQSVRAVVEGHAGVFSLMLRVAALWAVARACDDSCVASS